MYLIDKKKRVQEKIGLYVESVHVIISIDKKKVSFRKSDFKYNISVHIIMFFIDKKKQCPRENWIMRSIKIVSKQNVHE